MQRYLNFISKISFFFISFLLITINVQADCSPDPKGIDDAANETKAVCIYQKVFFAECKSENCPQPYYDYTVTVNLKMLYDPGNAGWNYSAIRKDRDGYKTCINGTTLKTFDRICKGSYVSGIYACDDKAYPNWDKSNIAPSDRINPYQTINTTSIYDVKDGGDSSKHNSDFEDTVYYENWLHENKNELCPPYVVVSYYKDKDYLVAAAGSYEDIPDIYDNTLTYKYSSNEWDDNANPRVYGQDGNKNGFKEVLPLVSDSSQKVDFTASQLTIENNDLKYIRDLVDTFSDVECKPEYIGGQIIEPSGDSPGLDKFLMASKIKLINLEKKGFGTTYTTNQDYIYLKELTTNFFGSSAPACKFFANKENEEKLEDLEKQKVELDQQLEENPEDEALLAQKQQLETQIADLQKRVEDFRAEFGVPGEPVKITCESFGEVLFEIFNILMIAAPILLIIFGTIDFGKATLASDDDAMKKAGKNFTKRAIAAILLFLLPTVINIILGVAVDVGVIEEHVNCFVEEANEQP